MPDQHECCAVEQRGHEDRRGGYRAIEPAVAVEQMIGQLLLHGNGGFDRAVSPAAVLVATLFHGAAFVLIGIALTAVVHLAVREIAWRMGLLIGLVIAAGFALGLIFAVTPATGERFSSGIVIGGSLRRWRAWRATCGSAIRCWPPRSTMSLWETKPSRPPHPPHR